jgi:hypothetical protein
MMKNNLSYYTATSIQQQQHSHGACEAIQQHTTHTQTGDSKTDHLFNKIVKEA